MQVLIIGSGSAGMRHARTLSGLRDVDVTIVPARPDRTAELRRAGFHAVARLDEALERKPLGAVVATNTGRHAADARRLLEAGCHVLVEKPLAVSGLEAEKIAETGRRAGREAHVACCLRFDAGLQWMRERLAQVGSPLGADVECLTWLPDWRPGQDVSEGYAASPQEGGVLRDLIHEIDYTRWLLGPQTAGTARLENRRILGFPDAVEESVYAIVQHGETTLTMRLSYVVRPPTRRLRIWCREGLLLWDGIARTAQLQAPSGEVKASFAWDGPAPMYQKQAEAWVAVLRGERPSPLMVDATEGAAELRVCDALRTSATTGAWESPS